MLIAEDGDGNYLPVGPVSSISEAREIAQHDLRARMRNVEQGARLSARRCTGCGRREATAIRSP
jgi:hypothetical protein